MSRQVLSSQSHAVWVSLLRGYAALTRSLSGELLAERGLSVNDYEVLLHLSHAPDRRLRRIDLAELVLLTQSGISRLLDGLERGGYVERSECPSDRRVTYAVLTGAGAEKLRRAAATHLAGIQTHLAERFTDTELETLAALLGRLSPDGSGSSCSP